MVLVLDENDQMDIFINIGPLSTLLLAFVTEHSEFGQKQLSDKYVRIQNAKWYTQTLFL